MHAGVETYLASTIPGLVASGHEIAFWSEQDDPKDRPQIPLPAGAPFWCADLDGTDRSIREIERWAPDVIFAHSLLSVELYERIFDLAPTVYFAHVLAGACITGAKVVHRPVVEPCSRRFGLACLVHYFPHRCGGRSPISMMREYGRQTRRQNAIRIATAVVVNSGFMRDELARYGIESECIYPFVPGTVEASAGAVEKTTPPAATAWKLLFLGRLDPLKGGQLLVEATRLLGEVGVPLHVTVAGEGPSRAEWEQRATAVAESVGGVTFAFVGWVSSEEKERLFRESHLLVVPSAWPEPFGLVGPEAALRGLPAAAFAVGGIPEWLVDGVNGHLADGEPPTARGLADAIRRCLGDPGHYRALSEGALGMARRYSADEHVTALNAVFAGAAARRQVGV